MKQNKKIAVTGGIGSGKSYLCTLLAARGYPVFSCDEVNRALWQDPAYVQRLCECFPDCATPTGIDREKLAQRVFSDPDALARLNALAHPCILSRLCEQMAACRAPCFAEVPLLYEGGYAPLFDAVIAVRRPREARIAAVAARDGLERSAIEARMARQFPPEQLEEQGCYLVENDGDETSLQRQIDEILKKLDL